jgi:hypothetical protein
MCELLFNHGLSDMTSFQYLSLSDSCSGIKTMVKIQNGACSNVAATECKTKTKPMQFTSQEGRTETVDTEDGCVSNTKKISGACTKKSIMGATVPNEPGEEILGPVTCGNYSESGCQEGETESKSIVVDFYDTVTVWVPDTPSNPYLPGGHYEEQKVKKETQTFYYEGKSCNPNSSSSPKSCGSNYTGSSPC